MKITPPGDWETNFMQFKLVSLLLSAAFIRLRVGIEPMLVTCRADAGGV